ncbi:MAG: sulfatase-like hydrolase/transferase [Bacteroidia bacterium]|nr:sulfatase-like hydrolase/transferase [Bacteroidia bacterium]
MNNILWIFGFLNTFLTPNQLPAAKIGKRVEQRPNVVLLIADDLGYGELGCQGNKQIRTPNIDGIAKNGVRFTAGYVTAPNSSPSRAGLLTGKFQTRFGYEFNPTGASNGNPKIGLPTDLQTLAQVFHNNGYATSLVGKWHLGGTVDFHPMRRGFDEFFGFLHEGHSYANPPWNNNVTSMYRRRMLPDGTKGIWIGDGVIYHTLLGDEPPYDANNPILRGSQPVEENLYLTDAFTREAIDFIKRKRNQPFFLEVAFNAVHSPLQGANKYMKEYSGIEDIQRRIFAAMLSNLDKGIGAIIKMLKNAGLEENTIIIFLSDNGGPTRELTSSNAPLRGEKGDMYEGGIRISFMVQWKGKIPAGIVYNNPVISCDIFPTVISAVGAAIPENLDGVDLLPYLLNENSEQPHINLFWRQGERTALRSGDWKIVMNNKKWELYNLTEDISETNNLATQNPEKFIELKASWERLNSEMIEPLFLKSTRANM